jgi:hypothetical protein
MKSLALIFPFCTEGTLEAETCVNKWVATIHKLRKELNPQSPKSTKIGIIHPGDDFAAKIAKNISKKLEKNDISKIEPSLKTHHNHTDAINCVSSKEEIDILIVVAHPEIIYCLVDHFIKHENYPINDKHLRHQGLKYSYSGYIIDRGRGIIKHVPRSA